MQHMYTHKHARTHARTHARMQRERARERESARAREREREGHHEALDMCGFEGRLQVIEIVAWSIVTQKSQRNGEFIQ